VSFFTHDFEGVINRFGVGKSRVIWYKVLFLPPDVALSLPFADYPRLRVRGEIADVPVAGAFMPTGDGRRYFIVSPHVCKGADVDLGSSVDMRFMIDDQDRVEIPEILAKALALDKDLMERWQRLTPGRRRGLTHAIHAARSQTARQKRLLQLIETVMG
jgi:Bacteriocin-protection, YdeI or OmpD-Associated/Domain of unknown function (DUF1905)